MPELPTTSNAERAYFRRYGADALHSLEGQLAVAGLEQVTGRQELEFSSDVAWSTRFRCYVRSTD